MAKTEKITITLPSATAEQVRELVGTGHAASVSGFVQHAVSVALDDVTGWASALTDALAETGGELSEQERVWADGVLDTGGRERRAGAA